MLVPALQALFGDQYWLCRHCVKTWLYLIIQEFDAKKEGDEKNVEEEKVKNVADDATGGDKEVGEEEGGGHEAELKVNATSTALSIILLNDNELPACV